MTTLRTVAAITATLADIEERRRQTLEELREAVKRDAGGELVYRPADLAIFKIARVEVTPIVGSVLVYGKRRRMMRKEASADQFAAYEELIGFPADFRKCETYNGFPVIESKDVPPGAIVVVPTKDVIAGPHGTIEDLRNRHTQYVKMTEC